MTYPANFTDLTGKRFGKLTVVSVFGRRKNGEVKWLCSCDCGNQTVVLTTNLNRGNTSSCGCIRSSKAKPLCEYENDKRNELALSTDKWEYVMCFDRKRKKHIVRCVSCGSEKKVSSVKNIADCVPCLREKKRREVEAIRSSIKTKECSYCGRTFVATRSTALYCCANCSDKAYKDRHRTAIKERQKTARRIREANARLNGHVDYSVTLPALIERDNRICKLCGRVVDEHDYVFVGDVFIAGNDYPSIDHIVPLSKGGVHQWGNVQLAHRICNSLKRDKTD